MREEEKESEEGKSPPQSIFVVETVSSMYFVIDFDDFPPSDDRTWFELTRRFSSSYVVKNFPNEIALNSFSFASQFHVEDVEHDTIG